MTNPYPIVDQRSLTPPPKRGPFGMGRRHREVEEIPVAYAHQVFVYRVNGEYILDRAGRDLAHEEVVAASHVSVVDIRQKRPVVVEFDIASAEASEFRVQVTFTCTVENPVQVVRAGIYDVAEMLTGYLKRHHPIFELGLEFGMAQVNQVRRDVRAQVTAYTTVRPPIVTGMSVEYADAEVVTPGELADFERTRRGQRFDHTIAAERQEYDHDLRFGGQRQEQQRDRDRLTYEHDRDFGQQRHERFLAVEGQRNEHLMEAEQREFERRELAKAEPLIGDDPLQALRYAFASGQLSATELAAELQAYRDRERRTTEALVDRDREDQLRELEWRREDGLRNAELDREERRLYREDRLRMEQWKHEERREEIVARRAKELQRALWAREDALQREGNGRADKKLLFETNLQVLREFAKTGHLDLVNIDLNRLVAELTGRAPGEAEPQLDAAAQPELTRGADDGDGDGSEDYLGEIDMRDEDGD